MEKQDATKAIRVKNQKTQYNEHSTPVFLTSSFTFDCAEDMRAAFADEVDTTIYSRFVNPNYSELVNKMCALEGTDAEDIKKKTQNLIQVSMKLGEAVYKSQQKPDAGKTDGAKNTKPDDKDNVVDADFEDVKDKNKEEEDKEKSA